MRLTLGFVLLVICVAVAGIITLSSGGGDKEFAMAIAGIAIATVYALFKHWPF